MAIGTLAAVAIGGGLLAGGVGSALGAKAQAKGAKKAANIAGQTADENNALTRDIYEQNKQTLSPYVQTGIPASYALNSFLGLAPTQQPQQQGIPQQQPNALAQFQGGNQYGYEGMDGAMGGYQPQMPGIIGGYGGGTWNIDGTQATPVQQPMVSGQDAFRQFIDNSDYGFQFGEGANRVNSGYAGQGTLQSGAAMKSLEDYRQNLQQGYRGEFLNLLGNQQGTGLQAAGAQAGVATQMGNTISANNNSAGTAAANAALVKGQSNPFANALGLLGGGLFSAGTYGIGKK
jgi:hypothetical protein